MVRKYFNGYLKNHKFAPRNRKISKRGNNIEIARNYHCRTLLFIVEMLMKRNKYHRWINVNTFIRNIYILRIIDRAQQRCLYKSQVYTT